MASTRWFSRLALGAALCLGAITASYAQPCLTAGNVLVDPGFELQTPPAQGGWTSYGYFSNQYAHTGSASMFNATYWDVSVTFQHFPAAPGSQWQLTGYGYTPVQLVGDPLKLFGIVQVSFFDLLGNDLGTVETAGGPVKAKVSNAVDATTPVNTWTFLDTGVATAPAGAAYIYAFTVFVGFDGPPAPPAPWQGVYFDDLNLKVLGVNHGQYVASIAQNEAALARAGFSTGAQPSAMVAAAARSNAGKPSCPAGQ